MRNRHHFPTICLVLNLITATHNANQLWFKQIHSNSKPSIIKNNFFGHKSPLSVDSCSKIYSIKCFGDVARCYQFNDGKTNMSHFDGQGNSGLSNSKKR